MFEIHLLVLGHPKGEQDGSISLPLKPRQEVGFPAFHKVRNGLSKPWGLYAGGTQTGGTETRATKSGLPTQTGATQTEGSKTDGTKTGGTQTMGTKTEGTHTRGLKSIFLNDKTNCLHIQNCSY